MSALLLAKLRKRGIRVARIGDHLEVAGPANVLTAAAVAHIREHKAGLLATLSAPVPEASPEWPPATVEAAVLARIALLRDAGLSVVDAERQAAEEILRLDGVPAHESARCDFHGCLQRKVMRPRLPCSSLYRCPACVPGSFAWLPRAARGQAR